MRHVTLIRPILGTVYRRQVGTCYNKPTTKFEVPNFTCYGNMKGVAKCRKLRDWCHTRTLKILPFDGAHTSSY